ncbi:macrophage mannose receptor 1-like [Branchiostoma lanceolatum]|uniref:macrophage mannose receptor 1-like n=1 Tax=Branchiostoma lanceolatum TaxID=7740 RepID=UPI003452F759
MPKNKIVDHVLLDLIDSSHHYYFGLNDLATEGTWMWEDGTPFDFASGYTRWWEGFPKISYDSYDCAFYHYGAHSDWANNIGCHGARFICQLSLDPVFVGIDICDPDPCKNGGVCSHDTYTYSCECTDGWAGRNCEGRCPSGYNPHLGSCFKAYDEHKTYNEAKQVCEDDGGRLAMPTDSDVDNFLVELRNPWGDYWIGLNDLATDDEWMWLDGTPHDPNADYNRWKSGEPNLPGAGCAYYEEDVAAKWADKSCSEQAWFFCQLTTGCPSGYTRHEGACFQAFHESKPYIEGRQVCADDGGLLAMPKNKIVDHVLLDLIDSSHHYYFGLNDLATEGTWMWEDGTPFDFASGYTRWWEGFPKISYDSYDCAFYHYGAHSDWANNIGCHGARFICQLSLGIDICDPDPCKNGGVCSHDTYTYSCECTDGWAGRNCEGRCPSGYNPHLGSCFKAYDEHKTYNEAKQVCEDDGGRLAMPTDSDVDNFLVELRNPWGDYWIGLNDLATDDEWMWLDGTPHDPNADYNRWKSGEPNLPGAGCAYYEEDVAAKWADKSCSEQAWFFCQLTTGCPSGYTRHEGACFQAFHESKPYIEGRQVCADDGGLLAMPKNKIVDHVLLDLIDSSHHYYFGLNDLATEGTWMWEDGTPFDFASGYTRWWEGFPKISYDSYDCAFYHYGAHSDWANNIGCHGARFICQLSLGIDICDPDPCKNGGVCSHDTYTYSCECTDGWAGRNCEGRCPSGYNPHLGSCFKAYDEHKTYNEAKQVCEDDGGRLAMPTDSDVDNFLVELRNPWGDYWIGLNDLATDDEWMWLDGTPHDPNADYNRWKSGEPNLPGAGCAYYEEDAAAKWADKSCSEQAWFFCQLTTGCPSGYTRHEGACFQAFHESKPYIEGRQVCADDGGLLAMPKNKIVDHVLLDLIDSSHHYYFGLNDLATEGTWMWEDGTPFDFASGYTRWWEGFPKISYDSYDCAFYHYGAHSDWANNIGCHGARFICQLSLGIDICDPDPCKNGGVCSHDTYTYSCECTDGWAGRNCEGRCPSGYNPHLGSCFKAYDEHKTYNEAKQVCEDDGGRLAMPTDSDVDNFLVELRNPWGDYWIGLNDLATDDEWMWLDGSPHDPNAGYNRWKSGEPNLPGAGCTYYEEDVAAKWADKSCSEQAWFFCQLTTGMSPIILGMLH